MWNISPPAQLLVPSPLQIAKEFSFGSTGVWFFQYNHEGKFLHLNFKYANQLMSISTPLKFVSFSNLFLFFPRIPRISKFIIFPSRRICNSNSSQNSFNLQIIFGKIRFSDECYHIAQKGIFIHPLSRSRESGTTYIYLDRRDEKIGILIAENEHNILFAILRLIKSFHRYSRYRMLDIPNRKEGALFSKQDHFLPRNSTYISSAFLRSGPLFL